MSGWVHSFAFSTLLRIEAAQVLDIPWVAHVCTVWPLYVVGSGNHYPTDYKGSFPWARQLVSAGDRRDSSQNQVADVEVALVDVAIMIAPKLLLISRMFYGGR